MSLSLVFDGNYFFYKTLYAFGGYSGGKKLLDDKKDQAMLMRKVATDFAHAIRIFGNPNRIVFTIDSHSWRKDVLIEEGSYKSNREHDVSAVNWDAFYKCMNEFGAILHNKGLICSREPRAEGDDLMHLWSNELFENGEDTVIITGDKDMYQCVKSNGTNFVIVYNPNSKIRKIVAPIGFEKWLRNGDYDLFDASTYMNGSKDLIAEAINTIPIQEIDPEYVIFEKVLVGDGGDTVPSICTWQSTNKNGKVINNKISEKMAARIYEIINHTKYVSDIKELPSRAKEIATGITSVSKQTLTAELVKSRLERNLKLVCLDNEIIPTDIQSSFIKSYNETIVKTLPAAKYDLNYLLAGTNYLSNGKTFEADIFSAF